MRRVLALAFLLFATQAFAPPVVPCEGPLAALVTPPPFGDGPYDAKLGKFDRVRSDSQGDVYVVAEGIGTVVTRRIPKDPDKPSYCTKAYDDVFKFAIEAPGYRFLETLYPPGAPSKSGVFEVVHVELAGVPKFLFLPDVRGRALPEVLADARVDGKIKTALEAAYQDALADLDRRIDAHRPSERREGTQDRLPTRGYAVERDGRKLQLSIRASQVVVSFDPANPANFKMTLVDPF